MVIGDENPLRQLTAWRESDGCPFIPVCAGGCSVASHTELGTIDRPSCHKVSFEAEKIGGIVVSLEVHRDTCTETPEKTYEIAERYHRATGRMIRFNFDFSHVAVVKHLNPGNYVERLLDHPEEAALMGRNARSIVEERLNMDRYVAEMADLLARHVKHPALIDAMHDLCDRGIARDFEIIGNDDVADGVIRTALDLNIPVSVNPVKQPGER